MEIEIEILGVVVVVANAIAVVGVVAEDEVAATAGEILAIVVGGIVVVGVAEDCLDENVDFVDDDYHQLPSAERFLSFQYPFFFVNALTVLTSIF